MAFRTPTFNVWAKVFRYMPLLTAYQSIGYSLCQHRGPDSHWDGGVPGSAGAAVEILFPKRSDVKGINMLPQSVWPDLVTLAGWKGRCAEVLFSSAKGAGFSNEYLLTLVWFSGSGTYPGIGAVNRDLPFVNTELEPPAGFTPLPLITPGSTWPI